VRTFCSSPFEPLENFFIEGRTSRVTSPRCRHETKTRHFLLRPRFFPPVALRSSSGKSSWLAPRAPRFSRIFMMLMDPRRLRITPATEKWHNDGLPFGPVRLLGGR